VLVGTWFDISTTHSPQTRDFPKGGPHSAGLREMGSSLNRAPSSRCRFPHPESLGRNSGFLGNRDAGCGDRFDCGQRLEGQAERMVPARPFKGHIIIPAGDAAGPFH